MTRVRLSTMGRIASSMPWAATELLPPGSTLVPERASWLPELEEELFSLPGKPARS
jgi:hypothetical protein